ncbi:MAG: penicillin-binding protein 2 [Candidatus Didemnitutus sp.]|nr:penicillin-binding protein 2 [Candidatus Didemnitutus sp.]
MSSAPIETHAARNPRLLAFYGLVALLVLVLSIGVGRQQLLRSSQNSDDERKQSQRRIIVPGPRGNIYDREGRVLVGNRARFSVVLNLAELRSDFGAEYDKVVRNFRALPKDERPNSSQVNRIVRTTVTERYLEQVNRILGRHEQIKQADLNRHFESSRLLPYTLIEDLSPAEYARLVEKLPVNSPLQVYASSTRYYPYGRAAAHVLGYVGVDANPDAEAFGHDDLMTFKMKGAYGRAGLEKRFDAKLQGQAGGAIYRVDPSGYKINPPLEKRTPKQGESITTSIDIDLQQAAEEAIGDRTGAAVALDVRTGEVLALSSKPDYDPNAWYPRMSAETYKEIQEQHAELNLAIDGAFPPGSTFKILTSIAALQHAAIVPDRPITFCDGTVQIGGRTFYCDNGRGHHGHVTLSDAIAHSCDVYYYEAGRLTTPDGIAEEARKFHFGQRTGIELPESDASLVPDTAWKRKRWNEPWYGGDTANYSIGQGFLLVTPLQMACFTASVARNELYTTPTLIHRENAPAQHTPPIGLSDHERAAIVEGMIGTTTEGTASLITKGPYKVPGVTIAGKTGTAQKDVYEGGKLIGKINFAWFICFAPAENPEIAIAVMLEGDTIGETYGGGVNAAPVANAIIRKYFEKKNAPAAPKAEFKIK